MTTIGSGAPPGEPFGGGTGLPAQHPPRPDAGRRPSGREERRRIGELLAEAVGTVQVGRVPDMPNASPWQRSNAVWHRAGIDWSRTGAAPRTSPPAGVPAPSGVSAYEAAPGGADPGAPGSNGTDLGGGRAAAGAEAWSSTRHGMRLPAVPIRPVAIATAAVVALGAGGYALFGTGGGTPHRPAAAGAIAADRLFATDPAAKTSGRTHPLTSVAASGGTVVVAGSEQGGQYARAQFLTSADGGRTWRVARIRAAGGDPPPGEYPQHVAGGGGAWAALGGTPGGAVSWTGHDTRTWTRQAAGGAFGPGDSVIGLARTGSGFAAVGTAAAAGGTQAIVWVSGDGRAWTRLGPDRLGSGPAGTAVRMTGVAAHGDTVVARGVARTTATVKTKKKKVQRTVEHEAFWRSADGGRTWSAVTVPQAQGSAGDVVAMASGPAGFFAAREASRATGSKKHRKTVRYGVIFGSPDGQRWAPAGQVTAGGYAGITGLRGGDGGLACLVDMAGGATAVLTGGDGKTWRQAGTVPPGRRIGDVAAAAAGPVVAGRFAAGDPYLTVAGAGDVDVAAIPGATHPERTVADVVADAGRAVAVGSSNGAPAVWTSPNGSAWSRVTLPAPSGSAPSGPAPRRLTGVVHGPRGWLAVGRAGDRALVLASVDGRAWQAAPAGTVLRGAGLEPVAAAASGTGYVVVGARNGTSAAAWYSPDLKTWSRSGDAGKTDLDGGTAAPKWIGDVVAGPAGFVAVGGQTAGKAARPAVWTSADGKKWALSPASPALPQGAAAGALTTVVARGGVLVAAGITGPAGVTGAPVAGAPGSTAFAAVSADGGRTWQPAPLPGAAPGSAPTAAVATAHGFVLAGTAGSDVLLWTSADGRTWRVSRPGGFGLDGPGTQRLDGVTVMGRDILAVGFTGDSGNETPTLWRIPVP